MPHVSRTSQARADLLDIWVHIAEDSIPAADRLLAGIETKCRTFAATPLAGRERSELDHGLRSFPFRSYVVFYQAEPDGILVIRVLHGARDLPTAISEP